jgi:hypothetical protein
MDVCFKTLFNAFFMVAMIEDFSGNAVVISQNATPANFCKL